MIGLTIGIVIGAGIFGTPSLVASFGSSKEMVLLAWALGGLLSIAGALCYAELASAYPNAGGDYHFLMRAFGPKLSFLFGWARMSVIQTGSIASLAFVFGDYLAGVASFGPLSAGIYAAAIVVVLTAINVIGVRESTRTQNALTVLEVSGVVLVIAVGLSVLGSGVQITEAAAPAASAFGSMMLFVLFTYGGWNEAAYISAELRDVKRNMARGLVTSLLVVTALYVAINWVYLETLGLSGAAQSRQIAADVLRLGLGQSGAVVISVLVAIAALTSANASILTGGRSTYAFGRDFPAFGPLGRWSARTQTPAQALVVQGAISLALVMLGVFTRSGLGTMIDFTAPVFWFFFLLTGISLFVLRAREPHVERPFRVPLYPLTPIVFCVSAAYLLYSSLEYARIGALAGVGVLAVGAVLLLFVRTDAVPESTAVETGR
jgi:amino acid transporter